MLKSAKYRRWTKEEDSFLIDLYNKKTNKELELIFKRTSGKISRRLKKLGLKKDKIFCNKNLSIAIKKTFLNGRNFIGKNNPRYKGGKIITKQGYIKILIPENPNSNSKGYYEEHRLIIEKHLGRFLNKNEHIHHINGIKTDNRIENLLITNKNDHAKIHAKKIHFFDWTGKKHTEESKKKISKSLYKFYAKC